MKLARRCAPLLLSLLVVACAPEEQSGWRVVLEEQPGALLSVTGTSGDDIWLVGADRRDGSGPTVLHFDGERFTAHETGDEGDLWWIGRAPSGTLWMCGDGGRVFRHVPGGDFEALPTPEPIRLFGVLPFADDEVWAVGGDELTGQAVVWRYDGSTWSLPDGLDPELLERRVFFKLWGPSPDDVWIIGEGGAALHYTAGAGWKVVPVPLNARLVTVHGAGDVVLSVGGFYDGFIAAHVDGALVDVTPPELRQLQGVFVAGDGSAVAVGNQGAIWERTPAGVWGVSAGAPETALAYHAVFRDDDGGHWAVGGLLDGIPLEQGILTYRGGSVHGTPAVEE